jgi:quercetin dioxygenase-like cupin family protein
MATVITGRTLDRDGRPIDGTGFDYDSEDRLAELLSQRVSPLYSQPVTGEWIFGLVPSRETNGEFERGVVVFRPGNAGPAEHIHPAYDEHFEIVQGEFLFSVDGQERRAGVGEVLASTHGSRHTFRCVSDGYGVVIGETRPAARIGEVISTLFGMAHEGSLTSQGRPKLLQAMVIGNAYADDTVFTSPPPAIAIPIAKALAPIGRLLGYRPTYAKYTDEAWWTARVEQPSRGDVGTA